MGRSKLSRICIGIFISILVTVLYFSVFVPVRDQFKETSVLSPSILDANRREISNTSPFSSNCLEQERADLEWQNTMKSRSEAVQNYCLNNKTNNSWLKTRNNSNKLTGTSSQRYLPSLLVDRRNKVLYCAVPKAASSTIKLLMALQAIRTSGLPLPPPAAYDTIPVHDETAMRMLGLTTISTANILELLNDWPHWRRFMIVRHPLERLASAYIDKFAPRFSLDGKVLPVNKYVEYFHRRFGREIVKRYRQRQNGSLSEGHDVTLTEFVTFVTDENLPERMRFNPHWSPYSQLCRPCLIRYDYIVKLEHLSVEMPLLWRRFYNITEDFKTIRRNAADATRIKLNYTAELAPYLIDKLSNFYRSDFELFQYYA